MNMAKDTQQIRNYKPSTNGQYDKTLIGKTPLPKHKCHTCNTRNYLPTSLIHHIKHKHNSSNLTKYLYQLNKDHGQYKCQLCEKTFFFKTFLIKHLHHTHFNNSLLDTIKEHVDQKYSTTRTSINRSQFYPQTSVCWDISRSMPKTFPTQTKINNQENRQTSTTFRKPQDDKNNSSKLRCKICFKVFQMETELIGHFDWEQIHSIYPNEKNSQEEADRNFMVFVDHIYECKSVHLCYLCYDLYLSLIHI